MKQFIHKINDTILISYNTLYVFVLTGWIGKKEYSQEFRTIWGII